MAEQIEIIVPTNWQDVTLKSYQKYVSKIGDLKKDDEIIIHSISSLCNIPLKVVKLLKVNDIKTIYKNLSKLISLPINKQVINKIELNGVRYGFHPSLDELTMGEFVDLDEYSKEGVDGLHYILSILYRPIIEEEGSLYKIEPYTDHHINNAKHFENLSIDTINGVMVFFYNLGSKCLMSSQNFLQRLVENQAQEVSTDGLVS
ncbi:MAG: hypothetical protein Unbinned6486contig1001_3 [Prokaryotic dsDNA virus sp.]|nr:MAG: hypothetical protein Unbinned6486contig1001_3 [Prokaryotic dsDNA virus sp.]|tara:strand:+ start:16228 stop:16836 length:609 start_codon:yes stop_codon:yes gene_type:complete